MEKKKKENIMVVSITISLFVIVIGFIMQYDILTGIGIYILMFNLGFGMFFAKEIDDFKNINIKKYKKNLRDWWFPLCFIPGVFFTFFGSLESNLSSIGLWLGFGFLTTSIFILAATFRKM